MSVAEDLGALIIKMNPYAGGLMEPHTFLRASPPPPPSSTCGVTPTPPTTTSNATPTPPTTTSSATPTPPTTTTEAVPTPPTPTPAAHPPDATCIWMEMDRYQTGDWGFKGQPRRIDTALRIAYRWAKLDDCGNFICWITDYLLIGYEGSNGGG
jgi:hypothetical protein